jgi:hypothetical protein
MEKSKGLVAFFDILGYQNFLQSNEPAKAIETIQDFLKKLKSFRSNTFPTFFGKETFEVLQKLMDTFTHLTISDSMLVTFKANKDKKVDYMYSLMLFSLYCSALHKEFFLAGLPVRGAIEYGEFVINREECLFAGVPIVEAYKEASRLSLSACIVGESALPKDYPPTIHSGLTKYRVPLRNGMEKDAVLVAPILSSGIDSVDIDQIQDIKQFIVSAFSKHNKTIGIEVQPKIENTEMFFRFCKAKYEQDPKPNRSIKKTRH